jgi:putative hemolysin
MNFGSALPSILRPLILRRVETLPEFTITDKYFTVKITRTPEEVEKALRLRFSVFNLEMGEGLESSFLTMKDEDPFDKQCDHLLIIENRTNEVIGTYRLQTLQMAEKGIGFYSNGEFQLDMMGKKVIRNAVELGRACISKDYRNTRVLFLLWRGIANYLLQTNKRYLFGCCSLTSQNSAEGIWLYNYLQSKGSVDCNIKILPQPGVELSEYISPPEKPVPMPPLMKVYFRYGAKIISLPAIDREFKTIDYLVLLDLAVMGEETFKLFLGTDEYSKFPKKLF